MRGFSDHVYADAVFRVIFDAVFRVIYALPMMQEMM
jgi:hypothetical protein